MEKGPWSGPLQGAVHSSAGVRGVTPCGFTPAPDTPQGPVLAASVVGGGALVSPFLLASEFVRTSKEK